MIYVLITLAALLRLVAPLGGSHYVVLLSFAGAAWTGAFTLFILLYVRPLTLSRVKGGAATRPISTSIRPLTIRPAADGSMLVDRRTLNALSGRSGHEPAGKTKLHQSKMDP
jgi:hypothetical protein